MPFTSSIPAFAVALAAFLLFWIQPLVARLLLPAFGGNQAVWNAAMVFFQSALLVGYALAAWANARSGSSRSSKPRLAAFSACAALAVLQLVAVAASNGWSPADAIRYVSAATAFGRWPALELASILASTIGLAAVALAATSPLVQSWAARSGLSPWTLYAWSNIGSLAALLAFPLVLEPRIGLADQLRAWSLLVPASFLATMAARFALRRDSGVAQVGEGGRGVPVEPLSHTDPAPTLLARIGWLARSAVASSLLLSVTAHITTDIAAVPLLWIVPLVLYLAAFAWAFAPGGENREPEPAARMARLLALPVLLWVGAQPRVAALAWLPLPIHLAVFGLIAAGLAAQLVATRPPTARLTGFYLHIAFGGLLGSAFNTLLCPYLFDSIAEYPIGIAAAVALLGARAGTPWRASPRDWALDLAVPAALAGLVLAASAYLKPPSSDLVPTWGLVVVAGPGLLALLFFDRPRRYAVTLAAVALAANVHQGSLRVVAFEDRSPYGSFRVLEEGEGSFRALVHGSTIHGRQAAWGPLAPVPLAYYHPTGPAGDAWLLFASEDTTSPVGVVGLGIGSLAAYAEPGRGIEFHELDPAMIALAQDTRWFRHVADCPGRITLGLGDGRLALERRAARARAEPAAFPPYGLLVLDAFSSGGTPVHLLTREAMVTYRENLAPRGIIAVHVSNRYLDLVPVLGALAADAGLAAAVRMDNAGPPYPGKMSSEWVLVAPADRLAPLIRSGRWQPVPATGRPWTDDHVDLIAALRF